ncbi:MAG: universal stress protein [Thermoplasmatales archaeon]|nr:universal stress protein [Thermoplasmatales archaeon]
MFQMSIFLAEKFKSTINLIYIIEEKTLNQTDKLSDSYRTHYGKEETKKEIIRDMIRRADKLIFNDAKYLFEKKNISFEREVIQGEFSNVVKGQINKNKYDLILMGFEKECLLNYRLFEEIDIPIWVESGTNEKSILAVCSNLAPNQKVPDMSITLSKILGWDLHMIYVVDTQDAVKVDYMGIRSEKKSEDELLVLGHRFVSDMEKKGIKVTLVRGSLEKETVKAAENIGAGLVILGREQKKKNILGIPTKGLKRKMAETCEYSILFVH